MQNQQPVAHLTWWKDWSVPGIITLAENQVEEALTYFAAQGFLVVDDRVLPEYAPSIGEAVAPALRQNPDIVLFMGNAVTEADVPKLQMGIALNSSRFVFVGESAVPVN